MKDKKSTLGSLRCSPTIRACHIRMQKNKKGTGFFLCPNCARQSKKVQKIY